MAANVNYDDKRFAEVKADEQEALSDLEKTYGDIISGVDTHINSQIDASKEYAETQKKNQQELTDFTIDTIEQQKAHAEKDYIKEQSGAYVDWQKESNRYGANAEQRAAMGMTGTGYSESSQVSMYVAYQNRVATAREAYTRAVLDYDNAIKEAQLQNNSVLAEIAYQALQQQLELSLQGFQYKNTLLLQKASEKRTIKNDYYTRWRNVLDQINTENALEEQQRQFDEQMKFEKEKWAWQTSNTGGSGGSGSSSSSSGKSKKGRNNITQSHIEDIAKSTPSNDNIPIDMASITKLGYGPISAEKLAGLVDKGEVIEYIEDGKRKFKKAPIKSAATPNAYAPTIKFK